MIANKTKSLLQETPSLPQLMDELLIKTYPSLFESLGELNAELTLICIESSDHELLLIPQKLFSELDALYCKEKLVLFPYIKQCWMENKKTATCAPFKNCKLHVTAILSLLTTIKQLLPDLHKKNDCLILVNNLESKLISMQKEKETNIFSLVRACTGCKFNNIH